MLINSRAVAFLLSSSISLITVAFLSLVNDVTTNALLVAGTLSFSSAFILIYLTLEFLIFKEVNKIYTGLDKIKAKDVTRVEGASAYSTNPIRRINQEITKFASSKEEEIDKLKKIETYRREFLADVSHELKTPIFAAQGYILTLLEGAMDDDKVKKKFLKKAAKSLNGLDILVQDLLTLSHLESGVIVMYSKVFDIQTLTMDVFDQLETKANKKNISLSLENEIPEGVWVNADYNRINQVLINLINNAIKYNNEDGWVKVFFKEEDDAHVSISVADNGAGISSEHIGRVFERFYRVEKSRSKKQGGSGLGLAIVKHILEGHNSNITVDSDINQGTTFTFRLEKGTRKEHEETEV